MPASGFWCGGRFPWEAYWAASSARLWGCTPRCGSGAPEAPPRSCGSRARPSLAYAPRRRPERACSSARSVAPSRWRDPSRWHEARRTRATRSSGGRDRLVAAGGPMIAKAIPGSVGRAAAVTAPGMMVLAIILFMGKVSGAHLNPGVSVAFALRADFPWRRVPGYVVAQMAGAVLAALFLQSVVHVSAQYGSNYPAPSSSSVDALLMEAVLTLGLVSVILGTASGAQQVGLFGAIGVGSYIALAGLWASPISGAS